MRQTLKKTKSSPKGQRNKPQTSILFFIDKSTRPFTVQVFFIICFLVDRRYKSAPSFINWKKEMNKIRSQRFF